MPYLTPNAPPEETVCLEIVLPKDAAWIGLFKGAFSELIKAYNFEDFGTYSAAQTAALFLEIYDQMVFSECDMGCCYDVVLHRVNPDTGRLEISKDGGVTWQPDPDDPASLVYQLPPPVTAGVSDTRCDAAANGQAHLVDIIDHDSSTLGLDASLIEIATVIVTYIIAVMLSAGTALAFLPVVMGIIGALVTLGQAAFDAYWTSTEKDKILCALYCNIGEDGSFTDVGYAGVLSYLHDNLTAGVPRDMLIGEIKGMGKAGLNNLCAYGVSSGADCSDCDCGLGCDTVWTIHSSVGDIFGELLNPTTYQADGYLDVQSTNINTDSLYYMIIDAPTSSDCCLIPTIETISGGGLALKARICGTEYDPFDYPSFIAATCCWGVLITSTEPFQVHINIEPC